MRGAPGALEISSKTQSARSVTPLRPFCGAVYVGSGYEKVRGGVYCGSVRYVGVGLKYRHYFGLCEIATFNGFTDVQRST